MTKLPPPPRLTTECVPVWTVSHNTTCDSCSANLTQPNSIRIGFVCGEHLFELLSNVSAYDGGLVDVDNLVANGYHAGSVCDACGEALEELIP